MTNVTRSSSLVAVLLLSASSKLLSQLSHSLWIIRVRQLVIGVYKHYAKCLQFNARAEHQQMVPLRAERLIPQRPFAVTNLDYAGSFLVRFSKGRGAKTTKGYVVLRVVAPGEQARMAMNPKIHAMSIHVQTRRPKSRRLTKTPGQQCAVHRPGTANVKRA